ncbi:unnamed protein product [Moneuplotes crassus]|uniref:Uncharacterized protein n=1 Tax=Euplotes crassus TaxID=5936 RepID=A0AAD1UR53_EUPCR|nr:unnamed protein product [Moneuplotes crassus]
MRFMRYISLKKTQISLRLIDEKTGDQVSILPNEEEPTEAEIKSETFSTPDTHNFDFTLESEPQVNYNNDWNNTSTEGLPDTEVHDVKMAMGHLHFGNKTYDYFDPSLPHDESVHEQNHSKVAYVVIGVFAILFIIALVWSIRKIYSCMVSSEEYSKFLDDRSGRSDSISSQGRYNNDPKLQEIRRRELQKLDDELKGELDPVQFYKKQVEGSTKPEESKREVKKLNLGNEVVYL